jgi:hypothetical protein
MIGWSKWLIAFMLVVLLVPAYAAPEKNDVRVLIDISGSMKQNDPKNLRRPALRMLVGLLQPGTRAGVWTFAKWTNPLVPVAEVDKAWKGKALSLSRQIGSPGMYTDIERVVDDAIKGWSGPPTTHTRQLVLLTDGMVDVSKQAAESEASRERILERLLPRLQQLGVKVHTIALSARADHDLMERLSGGTGGLYQQVEGADQLQRVFLKVFEQVGRPEGVPLKDNRFTVDASVREATILLFREAGSRAPVLVSPGGEEYSDSDLVAGVAWYRDRGYDLITVNRPAKGEWSLRADIDPDNRVMIVTDLKLETSEAPPAQVATGEPLLLETHLSNKGEVVSRKAFLRLLDVSAAVITGDGRASLALNDNGTDGDSKAGDGRYEALYRPDRPSDEVELLFSVESPTFMRQKRYHLAVHEPLTVTFEGEGQDTRAVAKVDTAVMQEGAKVSIWQGDRDKAQPLAGTSGVFPVTDTTLPVSVQVVGTTRLGNPIDREFGPFYVPGAQSRQAPSEEAPQPSEVVEKPVQAQPEPQNPSATYAKPAAQDDDWVVPAAAFGISNLVLIGAGLGVWWFMRKRRRNDDGISLQDDSESTAAAGDRQAARSFGESAEGADTAREERGEAA